MFTTEMLTTKQAADELGISQNGVLSAIKNGTMPATKANGQWQITRANVEYYAEHHRGQQGKVSPEKATERAKKAAQTNRERHGLPVVDEQTMKRIASDLGDQLWDRLNGCGIG